MLPNDLAGILCPMRIALAAMLCLVLVAAAPAKKKTPIEELQGMVADLQRQVSELRLRVAELEDRLAKEKPTPKDIKVGMSTEDVGRYLAANKNYTVEKSFGDDKDGHWERWYLKGGPYTAVSFKGGTVTVVQGEK